MFWGLSAAMLILAMAYVYAEYRNNLPIVWITKIGASTAFLVLAWQQGAMDSSYGQWILLSLFCSWLGDVLLIPRQDAIFKIGILSFFLAHVAYIVAFTRLGIDPTSSLLAAAPLVVAGGFILRWLLPTVANELRVPVIAYVIVITGMVATSVGVAWRLDWPIIAVAATMFWLSDLSVARERFIQSTVVNRLWGIPMYYGAQIVFITTLSG
tara:strand:+ start:1558 stop:2190 length:633 start_codon:yes stop_codon:yes gene_type:complete